LHGHHHEEIAGDFIRILLGWIERMMIVAEKKKEQEMMAKVDE
jgi:hypothetical protein